MLSGEVNLTISLLNYLLSIDYFITEFITFQNSTNLHSKKLFHHKGVGTMKFVVNNYGKLNIVNLGNVLYVSRVLMYYA